MKKLNYLILVLVFIGLLFVLGGGELLGEEVHLTRVVLGEERTPNGYVTVPFLKDSTKYTFINIAIDLNGDGAFSSYEFNEQTQEEWLVRNMGVRILEDEANNFSVLIPDTEIESAGDFPVHVVLSSDELLNWDGTLEAGGVSKVYILAGVGSEDISPLYRADPKGIRSGGFPFDYLGGTAFASDAPDVPPEGSSDKTLSGPPEGEGDTTSGQGSAEGRSGAPASFNEFHPRVPDITQGLNECVPTATANSLLWLAREYDFEDKMPEGGGPAVINELKTDLNWSADGVDVQADYLNGKRAFVNRRGIPIETHQVGGRFDTGIVAKIAEELKRGQDVEVDMEYGRYAANGSYRRVGGHMVTVVGAWTAGNSQFLDIHDPLSSGQGPLDIYKIDGTRVENYRYQGTAVTYIRYAIAESPVTPPSPSPTVTAEGEPSPEPTREPVTQEQEDRELVRDFMNTTELSFAHVAPGEYSEVYVSVQDVPRGTEVTVTLAGPAVDPPATRTVRSDNNGIAYFVFRIFNYGAYTATVNARGEQWTSTVVVN